MDQERVMTYPVELVGNVAKHDGGAHIAAIEDALTADTIVLIVWVTISVNTGELISCRTIANNATLVINARLDALGRG